MTSSSFPRSMVSSKSALPALLTILVTLSPSLGCAPIVSAGDTSSDPPGPVGSGTLYALSNDASGPVLVRLDPADGAVTTVAYLPTPTVRGIGAVGAVYDVARHRYSYVFYDEAGAVDRAVTIDVQTGAVVTDFTLANEVYALGLDETTGSLVCQTTDWNTDTVSIERLDATTGALTVVSTFPAPNSSTEMVFDGAGKYYGLNAAFDVAGSPTDLVTIDAATGAESLLHVGNAELGNTRYDSGLGRLISTSWTGKPDFTDVSIALSSIDVATGTLSNVLDIPGIDHVLSRAMAYDASTHRYFFVGGTGLPQGGSMWAEGNQIFTVDVDTGVMLGTSPTIDTDSGVYNLQFAP